MFAVSSLFVLERSASVLVGTMHTVQTLFEEYVGQGGHRETEEELPVRGGFFLETCAQ